MKTYTIKYTLLILFGIGVFGTSCEDYLTKTIPFEDVGFEPQLVVNAKVDNLTDTLYISISKNNNYADAERAEFTLVPNVTVEVTYDDTETFVAIPFDGPAKFKDIYNYMVIFEDLELSGKSFSLKATHSDYPSVESTIFLPIRAEFVSLDYEQDAVSDFDFGYEISYDRIRITLKDNPETDNYFAFKVSLIPHFDTIYFNDGQDTFIFESSDIYQLSSRDPDAIVLNGGNAQVLFKDEDFNGQQRTFEVLFEAFGENYVEYLQFEYANITESDYLFRKSYDKYASSQDFGIFSEPTTLYTNIEGGLGLFSADEIQIFDVN